KPQPGRELLTGTLVAGIASTLWQHRPVAPLLSSFSETALQAARQAAPALPRALLMPAPLSSDWVQRLERLGCVALHVEQSGIDSALVAAVHAKGYKIAGWTVNDPARAQQLLQWGCDAVFTDAIDTLPGALQLT
ncbi:MAG TPA: glycerophosphodiester phosphodiesterase family protein, partial [Pusillimonas sp.]|uniref:glycerophosphodiester phosphodiesterase family protein n=1 Tax=Pusillimonas sp. TaxID=3040095 RepID=UPI002C603A4D